MTEPDTQALTDRAIEILKENDRGAYTIPTKGLYPFQWNWDSCLTALGQRHFDEDRAWTEIETLFAHQWPDGMVPHIVFHVEDDGYFPGPNVWATGRPTPTSGITQPAVAGFAVRRLWEAAADRDRAAARARPLLEKIAAWHRWFYRFRDPAGEGLVAIIHPWESGRDNSIDWDAAFERVPTEGIAPYTRRDTQHADPAHRPTKAQYDRYLWLVEHFRGLGWDNARLHDASPFQLVDPGFNAILIRACADLAALAEALDEPEVAAESRAFAERGQAALEAHWSDRHGQYLCRDRVTGELVNSTSVGGLLAAFAAIPPVRVATIAATIAARAEACRFIVPSHDPRDPRFNARRYWRGPAWLVVNYMIADGLRRVGETATADAITDSSLRLIRESGFAEYYDPMTGAPLGGGRFTWTAAMVLEALDPEMKVLALGAHPDDLEIFAFGTLLAWRAMGGDLALAIATDGAAGGVEPPETLRALRRAEAEAAAAPLGTQPRFLDFPDGKLMPDGPLVSALAALVAAEAPDLVLTHAPNDYHADHRALSAAASQAVGFSAPLAFCDTLGGTGFVPTHWVDVTAHFPAKCDAIRAHLSQDPERFVRRATTLAAHRAAECNGTPDDRAEAFRFEPRFPFADIRALLPPAPPIRPVPAPAARSRVSD